MHYIIVVVDINIHKACESCVIRIISPLHVIVNSKFGSHVISYDGVVYVMVNGVLVSFPTRMRSLLCTVPFRR